MSTTPRPSSAADRLPEPNTAEAASLYQRLRGHLGVLKLADAAEALPTVLDQAAAEDLSMTATLERLLSIEVAATEARRLTGRLRFACLPTPASLEWPVLPLGHLADDFVGGVLRYRRAVGVLEVRGHLARSSNLLQ